MKAAIFIDGGHLRVLVRQAGHQYNPDYIEAVASACITDGETLLRVLYYDCAPYSGSVNLPVSGQAFEFRGSDDWLKTLAAKPMFAVRLGSLKFRGFVPKKVPITQVPLVDDHFRPRFEQKGVDMRIGLDIANHAAHRSVDRIILITGDTDCLPAMKLARTAGLEVILIQFPKQRFAREMLWHSDTQRVIDWPTLPLENNRAD